MHANPPKQKQGIIINYNGTAKHRSSKNLEIIDVEQCLSLKYTNTQKHINTCTFFE